MLAGWLPGLHEYLNVQQFTMHSGRRERERREGERVLESRSWPGPGFRVMFNAELRMGRGVFGSDSDSRILGCSARRRRIHLALVCRPLL